MACRQFSRGFYGVTHWKNSTPPSTVHNITQRLAGSSVRVGFRYAERNCGRSLLSQEKVRGPEQRDWAYLNLLHQYSVYHPSSTSFVAFMRPHRMPEHRLSSSRLTPRHRCGLRWQTKK